MGLRDGRHWPAQADFAGIAGCVGDDPQDDSNGTGTGTDDGSESETDDTSDQTEYTVSTGFRPVGSHAQRHGRPDGGRRSRPDW